VWTRERFGDSFDSRIIQQKRGGVMKFRIALLAALTMVGDVAIAQNGPPAATPILSGKYIVRVTHVCQPTIAVTQSQSNQGPPTVTDVTVGPPGFSGDANQNIGTVDFDHASGLATLSAHSIDGSPFVLTMNGGPRSATW
jgi:hypothetical protein